MISTAVKQNKFLIAYYIILLGAFFFLMRPNAMVPMYIRLGMLALCFAPVLIRIEILPFTMLCFYVISSLSFTAVLPSTTYYFVLIVFMFYVFYKHKTAFVSHTLLILLYFLFISLFYYDLRNYLIWILIVVLLIDMVRDKKDIQYMFYAFLVISAFLSILFLVHRGEFLIQYGDHNSDLERSTWINSNMYGAAISAGSVLCVAYLTNIIKLSKTMLLSVICVITLLLSFITLVLNASRGALLACIIPSLLMFLMSKTKMWIKILVLILGLYIVYWMIKNNAFDLLLARIEEDTFETGGGRTGIWQEKFKIFFNDANLLELVFGMGLTRCNNLGGYISTHNDFITALIAYGIVGFILFFYFIVVYPIRKIIQRDNIKIIVLLLYVYIECFVLEPFFRGYIYVTCFFMYILKYIQIIDDSRREMHSVLKENK